MYSKITKHLRQKQTLHLN